MNETLINMYKKVEADLRSKPTECTAEKIQEWLKKSTVKRCGRENTAWHIHPYSLNKSSKQYNIKFVDQYTRFVFSRERKV